MDTVVEKEMNRLVEKQRSFFLTHVTRDVKFRLQALKKLKKTIIEWEPKICEALMADLGKCRTETYMTEIGMVLAGLTENIKHLRRWSRPKKVMAPLAQFPSTCRVQPEPYGVSLILSPWNYPILLCLDPLAAALAAGNCAVVKPSSMSPATSKVIADMLSSIFEPEYVTTVLGGRDKIGALLEEKFDYIFFTGSPVVGHVVMEAAARNLTPVTLELGGKSPCIVDETANIRVAARRIAFGKILNAGQTCVAPDYLFIHSSRKQEFVEAYRAEVKRMLGEEPLKDETFTHIINERHFQRLNGLLAGEKALVGGKSDAATLRIEPTLLDGVTPESPCMKEEIFGPILPMMTWDKWEEVEQFVLSRPRPLASYLFTTSSANEKRFVNNLSFGGGCVNDTIIHLAVHGLPFGGVAEIGMGAYHGKAGLDTFTHYKSVLTKANWLDLPMRYHPYTSFAEKLLRLFLR
ncbi:MAG: aldehyde dehydrogenase [Akkermansia sp.]|nr:aldehyde dehydrogenase [Akkermansia sp.]